MGVGGQGDMKKEDYAQGFLFSKCKFMDIKEQSERKKES